MKNPQLSATVEKRPLIRWLVPALTFFLSAWIALLALSAINLFVFDSPHQDQSWYLYAAQTMLSGAQLYGPRLVDPNPPLIIWFSAVPVALAHLLHLEAPSALKLIVFALIAGSVAWSERVLRLSRLAAPAGIRYLALASLFSAELLLHGFDVGQREHLMFILIAPYVLFAACGDSARFSLIEVCALGVAAGIGVCFKPQMILILIALGIFLAISNRSLRRLAAPDFLGTGATVLSYVALIRLVSPLYFKLIPVLRDTYWAYGSKTILEITKAKSRFNIILLLAIALTITLRRRLRYPAVPVALLLCSVGAFIAFCLQHTGWTYQAYPFQAFLLEAILWLAIDLSSPLVSKLKFNRTFALSAALILLAFLPVWTIHKHRQDARESAQRPYLDTLFSQYPPHTPVVVFTTSLDAFPVVPRDHLVWASRSPCLWKLPAILQNQTAEAGGRAAGKTLSAAVLASLAADQRSEAAEDLEHWKPTVAVIRECPESGGCQGLAHLNIDPLAWFLQSPQFKSQWSNYRFQTRHDNFVVYTRIP